MSKEEETYNVPLDAVNEGNLEYATVEGVNLNYPMNVEEPVYDEVKNQGNHVEMEPVYEILDMHSDVVSKLRAILLEIEVRLNKGDQQVFDWKSTSFNAQAPSELGTTSSTHLYYHVAKVLQSNSLDGSLFKEKKIDASKLKLNTKLAVESIGHHFVRIQKYAMTDVYFELLDYLANFMFESTDQEFNRNTLLCMISHYYEK